MAKEVEIKKGEEEVEDITDDIGALLAGLLYHSSKQNGIVAEMMDLITSGQ